MKEISKECISRIRAIYLGQRVVESQLISGKNEDLILSWHFMNPNIDCILSLRSIDSLTANEFNKMDSLMGVSEYDKYVNDYLQQIGIALPYWDIETDTHYSVEDLVSAGVYKLRNESK